MSFMKQWIWIPVIALLCACGSTPRQVQYYLLSSGSPPSSKHSAERHYVLAPVRLADYLEQPNLVLQQGDHGLHITRYHSWAEPLDTAVHRTLRNALTRQQDCCHIAQEPDAASPSQDEIRVYIEQFHPSDKKQLVLAAEYRIGDQFPQRFYQTLPLTESGYSHSVSRMNELLEQLAQQIAGQLVQN